MSWWSWLFTSGSSIEESYSLTKSDNPSAAPDIDIIGVFKLCAIPPINWPSEAKRSLSISIVWLSLIWLILCFVNIWVWLKARDRSANSSSDVTINFLFKSIVFSLEDAISFNLDATVLISADTECAT